MANFWKELKSPFFVLAPMEDVTDTVFRQIVASVEKPDVMFTEFANVDAILHNPPSDPSLKLREGRYTNPVLQRLIYSEIERPIVAQIWGTDPEKFYKAAAIVKKLGFDGIDINLGCPQKKIIKSGACAALIGQNELVSEIIAATISGAKGLPVSVKTRLGIKKIMTEDWVGFLLTQNLAAITIHARTAAEKSEVPAHWDEIGKAVSLRNQSKSKTLIIGNGDVDSMENGKWKIENYGVDGVMIGRGVLQNIGMFKVPCPQRLCRRCCRREGSRFNREQKIKLFLKHVNLFKKTWGNTKNFAILKKFTKIYINGFIGAAQVREVLMQAHDLAELKSNAIILLKGGDLS